MLCDFGGETGLLEFSKLNEQLEEMKGICEELIVMIDSELE